MESLRSLDVLPTACSAIQYLYANNMYVDFHFISKDGGERFGVHKLILCIHSSVLADVINENKSCNSMKIDFVDNLALQNMIRYFYDEAVVLQNIHDIIQTKEIADRFELDELEKICERKLSDIEVNTCNVLTVFATAKEFKNEAKATECLRLIGENRKTLFTSPEFTKLQFEHVLSIFEKLREMNTMTEVVFLRSGIRWLESTKNVSEKNLLKKKVEASKLSGNEFLDIIVDHPDFFSSSEISNIAKEIRAKEETEVKSVVPETMTDENESGQETSTDLKESYAKKARKAIKLESNDPENVTDTKKSGKPVPEHKEIETEIEAPENLSDSEITNTVPKEVETCVKQKITSEEKGETPVKLRELSIRILKEGEFNGQRIARITIKDGISTRSVLVEISDTLKQGLLGTILEKKSDYTYLDTDVTYEGLYYMLAMLQNPQDKLLPRQYVEVLKAAEHFQIAELLDKCVVVIGSFIDYDPVFLDGLRKMPLFTDRCLHILLMEPLRVILHPNFIDCSADLILLLLQQDEIKVKEELQLLLFIIMWLEARNRQRWHFRSAMLKNLAFENISVNDFKYVIMFYPGFFTETEKNAIIAYKNAIGPEVQSFREKLPEWYNFKPRQIL